MNVKLFPIVVVLVCIIMGVMMAVAVYNAYRPHSSGVITPANGQVARCYSGGINWPARADGICYAEDASK